MRSDKQNSRLKLLDSALTVFRTKGYAGTRVEDICEKAGLTKGSFFHHFESKQSLAIAAAEHWSVVTDAVFEAAPYQHAQSARARLLGYVGQRRAMLKGRLAAITCLAGTLIQETYATVPGVRDAFAHSIQHHLEHVTALVEAARQECAPEAKWSAREVAEYMHAVLQGAFVLAKAEGDIGVADRSLKLLEDYLERLLERKTTRRGK
jgi:TetR/AcrR family transcriptional regulator, transcriptional repressor for nem operon